MLLTNLIAVGINVEFHLDHANLKYFFFSGWIIRLMAVLKPESVSILRSSGPISFQQLIGVWVERVKKSFVSRLKFAPKKSKKFQKIPKNPKKSQRSRKS